MRDLILDVGHLIGVEHLAHLEKQRARTERLGQKRQARLQHTLVHSRAVRVARRVDNLQTRSLGEQFERQRSSAAPRHDHVGEQEMDVRVHALEQRDRVVGGCGVENGLTEELEDLYHAEQNRC